MLDREGHLIHIDYGFILSTSPGGVGFETAPFKACLTVYARARAAGPVSDLASVVRFLMDDAQLSVEYIQVLGGPDGEACRLFENLLLAGFRAVRAHIDELTLFLEVMQQRTLTEPDARRARAPLCR